MEDILALAAKEAEAAEVYRVSVEETDVRFEANRLKQVQTRQQTSLALRVIKHGRTGYATTTGEDGAALVAAALETAQFGTEAKFRFPGKTDYPQVDVYDAAVAEVPADALIKLGEQMIGAITGHTPEILCEAGASRGVVTVSLVNSAGGRAGYRQSFCSLDLEGTIVDGTDMLFVGESDSSCRVIKTPDAVTKPVLWQLEMAKSRAAVPSRTMPVVFTPNGFASGLVMPLMVAFNGKTVLEGASPVGDKLGQPVFDRKFSVRDDPTLAYRPGSRPADDEGVPSRVTPLVTGGVASAFIYDLQTAALAGKESTGNGSRSRGGLPQPSASTIVIAPGEATLDEMLADMQDGLVVEQLMGAGQGNVLGGDFSGNVLLGYRVENGKITGRVKDTMVSGNIYKALKDIAALGKEAVWVGGHLQTPHIYLPAISVASKG